VPLGLVVPVSGGAAGVVVAACARRSAQRSQCPDRADCGQASVFDMPVQHNGFLAAGAGDRGGSSEGFEPAGIGEAGAVVADLSQGPDAGQHPQAGKAGDDLGVRVSVKMGDRRLGELVNRSAGGVELAQQSTELDAHGVLYGGWLVQAGAGEDLTQPLHVAVKVAAATGLGQPPGAAAPGSRRRLGPGWALPPRWCAHRRGPARLRAARRTPPARPGRVFEQVADLVADLLTCPHRVLLSARQHPDSLDQPGVGGQQAMRVGVGADDVGQQHRIGSIGLGARHRIPCPIPRCRQRVDRIDRPAGFAQCSNPQSTIGLDRHRDQMLWTVASSCQQFQQVGESGGVVVDSLPRHRPPGLVDNGDVVMGLCPVDSAVQVQNVITSLIQLGTNLIRVTQRPNRGTRRSVISLAVRDSSTPQDSFYRRAQSSGIPDNRLTLRRARATESHHQTTRSAAKRAVLPLDVEHLEQSGITGRQTMSGTRPGHQDRNPCPLLTD
jgi:hypothetical protein